MTAARPEPHGKAVVRRLVDEVMNAQRLDALDELCTPSMGDTVVGRFTCSATHIGEWRGHPATGTRFENVDEVYFFGFEDGRIAEAWGLEDTLDRMRQLGLAGPS